MHKNDFFPFIFFSYHSFSLSYLELQIIFPCRDIGPATATLDPRPRHWTRDRDFGPATGALDPRPRLWTRDPRPATISQTPVLTILRHGTPKFSTCKRIGPKCNVAPVLKILVVPRPLGTGKRGTAPKIWRALPIFLARVNGVFVIYSRQLH